MGCFRKIGSVVFGLTFAPAAFHAFEPMKKRDLRLEPRTFLCFDQGKLVQPSNVAMTILGRGEPVPFHVEHFVEFFVLPQAARISATSTVEQGEFERRTLAFSSPCGSATFPVSGLGLEAILST